jgi:flavin reductase (DIM6/NTAB) family NADH-FMN oxidoreductase RutF
MTNRVGSLPKAHRLFAPRIAYLVGTRSPDGEPNLIPVSNVTSISTDPQLIVVAVYRAWKTYDNLQTTDAFTVSVPTADQQDGVWKLGARYSRYDFPDRATKLTESGLALDHRPDLPGPVLTDGIGWLSCRITARPDVGGDHGVYIGEITHVEFNDDHLTTDGTPTHDPRPLMQITGNRFTAPGPAFTIPFGQ